MAECWERAPNCCEFSLVTIVESESYALMVAQKPQGKEESLAKAGCPMPMGPRSGQSLPVEGFGGRVQIRQPSCLLLYNLENGGSIKY